MSDRTPEEIIKDLAPAYKEWKGGEKGKNKLKDEFFEAITKHLRENGEPAEDLIRVTDCASDTQALEEAEKQRPGWIADAVRPLEGEPGSWECIIVEDPAFMPFTVEYDGQVWGRQVVEGATMLDDERIKTEDPYLYKTITSYPNWNLLEDIAYEAGMDPSNSEFEHGDFVGFDGYLEWQCERHGVHRTLRPLDELPDEVAAQLRPYFYLGTPQIKLPAPKKVKA